MSIRVRYRPAMIRGVAIAIGALVLESKRHEVGPWIGFRFRFQWDVSF